MNGRGREGQPLSSRDLGFDPDDIERSMGPYIRTLEGEAYRPETVIPVVHVPEHQIPGVDVEPEGTRMVMARVASVEALAAAGARALESGMLTPIEPAPTLVQVHLKP